MLRGLMEPPRHWFARPLTSRGDFASAPASLQACFPTYTVRSCDPLSLPQARPRTQLPSPSDWQTAPGTARGCMDLPGHTRAHACTRKGTHTGLGMCTQAPAPTGTHVHTSRHTLTPCKHNPPSHSTAPPHPAVCPGPSLPTTLTLAQGTHTGSHSLTLPHTHPT